ncbi:hypothetical protein GCM10010399_92940 [Dactylosporangium fulvum]|uniref:Endonuclease domain-containing protein n=1 Tax=Dactylosporangium fulvum TaxID=53359 RepID=A0ABY5W739_9ACTN|nr:endonuclease domain-containing protein [Dactylosporangium fulvum]UWP85833.1 endonuclease domain-containing protein [Dactylosporangium fulvum]
MIVPMPRTPAAYHLRCAHLNYELTCTDFDQLWSRTEGHCEICGIAGEGTPHGFLHVDHEQSAGKWAVRGLLCSRCNTMLGRPGLLTGAAVDAYLTQPWRDPASRPQPAAPAATDSSDPLAIAIAAYNEGLRIAIEERNEAIRAAAAEGMKQADIVRETGYSRETIRQILNPIREPLTT